MVQIWTTGGNPHLSTDHSLEGKTALGKNTCVACGTLRWLLSDGQLLSHEEDDSTLRVGLLRLTIKYFQS